jgi:hypothetical protein
MFARECLQMFATSVETVGEGEGALHGEGHPKQADAGEVRSAGGADGAGGDQLGRDSVGRDFAHL